jgi:cytochrome P450
MQISTRKHAILDLAAAGAALAFPRLLGASNRFTKITTALALGKLGYTLLTRPELGIAKRLQVNRQPMLEAAGAMTMGALPFLFRKKEKATVTACAVGVAAWDLVNACSADSEQDAGGDGCQRGTLPRASLADVTRVTMQVVAPTLSKGPIIRRPSLLAVAERLDLDTLAVKTLQRMRAKYGEGPVMVNYPFRTQAVLLAPEHVRRVLEESPDPFTPATSAKRAALAHFEPEVSLVSKGSERAARRQLNEQVLATHLTTHPLVEHLLPVVREEASRLLNRVREIGELRWDDFSATWFAIVRRIVFGDSARTDQRITDLMAKLRSDANWVVKPIRHDLRDELHTRIRVYLERAEPGSLAAYMAGHVSSDIQAPEQQIPQWLFAFDPAAMATFRALGLLAAHPHQLERAREEGMEYTDQERVHRPLLRAAVLEALRLWPTTPLILRETMRETYWDTGIMPEGTSVVIFAPFFHRDDQRLPFAHTFHPDLWIEDDAAVQGLPPRQWPLVPFSGGPGHCPGHNLVLLLTSAMLGSLIADRSVQLTEPHRMPPGKLPGSQDHFTLRFRLPELPRGTLPQKYEAAARTWTVHVP